ncbi:MAG: hypothetical protein QM753_10465 [Thermomicrobiales bacterium]
MTIGSDIFIGAIVPADTLRTAFAHAYAVPVDRVVLLPEDLDAWPDADVVLDTFGNERVPGDYPMQVQSWGPEALASDPAITRSLAIELGIPIITDAGTDDPDGMALHLPDGSTHIVSVEQDDDEGFRNTIEMRRVIGRSHQIPARAA